MISDITGQRFARVYVRGLHEIKDQRAYWDCLCDCGITFISRSDPLKSGRTKSCGCFSADRVRTHGQSRLNGKKTSEFRTWQSLLQRCQNPNDRRFADYGGRGITVCERWLKFENFIADMGHRPTREHSIDRRDNDGNYEPRNCRWATRIEQANNRSRTPLIAFEKQVKPLAEWARIYNLKSNVVWNRIFKLKWSYEKAFTTPGGAYHTP